MVCLTKKFPICTPCGHIFCWDCILEHAKIEHMENGIGKCLNCRFEFLLNRVVPLLNY